MSENAAADRKIKVRTDKFVDHFNALKGHAAKCLPTAEAEMRAALMVAAYQPTFDRIGETGKKLEKKYVVQDQGGKPRIVDALGLARKREELNAVLLTITLPPKLITKADLPKVTDDKGDLENRAQQALLMAQLGPFFDWEAKGEDKRLLEAGVDEATDAALDALLDEAIPMEPVPAVDPLAAERGVPS